MEMTAPAVKRVKGPVTMDVNGAPMVLDEVIYLDYGKKGVTTIYIAPPKGAVDLNAVDRILSKHGICIDREASARAAAEKRSTVISEGQKEAV